MKSEPSFSQSLDLNPSIYVQLKHLGKNAASQSTYRKAKNNDLNSMQRGEECIIYFFQQKRIQNF